MQVGLPARCLSNCPAALSSQYRAASSWTPREARQQFRVNKSLEGAPTSSYCPGYLQANIAILPSALADDFTEFCRLNEAASPVLYRSEIGELDAPPIAKGSDIRTDLTKYIITRYSKNDGQKTSLAWKLTEHPWDDMVTFYIGCSCSLEDMLISSGIPVQNAQEEKVVSMYETNIESVPVGRFSCPNTVVSMRPVRKDHLEKLVAITGRYDALHGAPVHIGDPAMIGIADITRPDHGNPARIDEGHVPVFWACGVTTSKALRSAKPEICFTHNPGCVFICDPTCGEYFHGNPPALHSNEQPKVIPLQDEPFFASILGETAFQQISQLERVIQDDPGRRNIEALHTPGELVKASLRLSHASSVAIVTGFPCNVGKDPPDETDGPPGALTMAKTLQALGKKVTLVSSHYNTKLMNQFVSDCVQSGVLKEPINVEEFTPSRGESDEEVAIQFLYPSGAEKKPRFDALVAIEAVGRTEHGTYSTMRMVDLLPCCRKSPVDELFIQAGRGRKGSISTIGIGDGGNEIGMGNVREKVAQHIENGADIACSVSVDHLITAGVSNWGGWALAMSVVALQNCRIHSRYVRRGTGEHRPVSEETTLNTVQQERKVLEFLVSHGVCDGIRGKPEMSVDGLDFDTTHVAKLQELFAVLR